MTGQYAILRRIASNGSWWLGERVGLLTLSLATNVFVVRSLGPVGFGELSYVLAIVALLAPLAQFGLSSVVARALLERPDDELAVLRAALVLRIAGCAAALALGGLWMVFGESKAGDRWVVLVLLTARFATAFQIVEFWFQVRSRASALVPWRTSAAIVSALLKIFVAAATGSAIAVACVFAVEYVLQAVASMVALRRTGGFSLGPTMHPSAEWVTWLAGRVPWLLASAIAEAIYFRIDIVLLERMRGSEEVGIYAAAAGMSEVWYMVPVALVAAVFPELWARRGNAVEYHRGLQVTLDGLVALAIALAVFIQFFGLPIVELLFGREFLAAVPVLQIHIWAGAFVFMRALLNRWMTAEDLLRFALATQVVGLIANVALNLLLIPSFGAVGAAVATVISYGAASWLSLFISSRTRQIAWMMTRALLLPVRWRDLGNYSSIIRSAAFNGKSDRPSR